MNYLGRPVFEFDVDWSPGVSKPFNYDLREVALGFGAEFFTSLQSNVVQGWKLATFLKTSADVQGFDDFFAALTGRLTGFWLPTPMQALQITASVSATSFDITDCGLRDTWEDHPDIYLWFKRPGLAAQIGKIQGVVLHAAGVERVTLTAALGTAASPADTVSRLHYVRLADDTERAKFTGEGQQQRNFNVVELPTEYAAFETGEQPIFLYHFWCAAPMDYHWRFTSFAAGVVSGNELFAKFAMKHGSLKRSAKLENETLSIEAKKDDDHPFALFLPIPFSRPVNVEVFQTSYGDPDTTELLFTGQVRSVNDDGDKLTARCDSWLSLLNRKVPRMMFQEGCNHTVFDPLTCKVVLSKFDTMGTVTAVDTAAMPPTVTLTLNNSLSAQMPNWTSDDWFAGGYLQAGFSLSFRVRTILSSTETGTPGELLLELNAPLPVNVGDEINLIPGCDGTPETCIGKYKNFDNFGGFRAIPKRNLSLKAIDANVSQGGKK